MSDDVARVNAYLAWMRDVKRRSGTSTYKYGQTYKALLLHLEQHGSSLGAADTLTLRSFVQRSRPKVEARGGTVAPSTLKREIMELRSLYRWLHQEHLLEGVDPTVLLLDDVPKVDNEDPKPPQLEHWRRLWQSDLADGDRVAFGLALFVGLRRHEVTMLHAGQFHDGPPATLAGVKRKGAKKQGFHWSTCVDLYESRLPEWIGDRAQFLDAVDRIRRARADAPYLLPWDRTWDHYEERRGTAMPAAWLNPDRFNKQLRHALERSGQAPDTFTPHQLRHGFGSNLVAAGVPVHVVSRLMGHSSTDVTMRYVKLAVDPLAEYLTPSDRIDGGHRWA